MSIRNAPTFSECPGSSDSVLPDRKRNGPAARLSRQLWVMAAGIVGLTVTLMKLLG